MQADQSFSTALAELTTRPAWAMLRLRDAAEVLLLGGEPKIFAKLTDIPLATGKPQRDDQLDWLVAVPFRQINERGFTAHDDGTPLTAVQLDFQMNWPLTEVLAELPQDEISYATPGSFETSDSDYAAVVAKIISDEIGQGEGANLVIGRNFRAVVADWSADKALSVFRRLLENERGAYWTFCFFTGDRYLIGASPERHVSMTPTTTPGVSDVRMNPISGTFRLRGLDVAERKTKLLEFLADEKEIYELFMVVDEELKMMCDICHEGGQVLGPYLKPMTHLVHTEYLLAGRTRAGVLPVLRDTMFAATVTGSPVENACKLINQYEQGGRGYYSGALALIGRDVNGQATLDSPIVIRTADVTPAGELRVTAGATLVRDSDPDYEVAETHAKAGGILSAFGLVPAAPAEDISDLTRDEDVLIALASRNQRLSRFWLTDQSGAAPAPALAGKTVAILEGEDDFVNMLQHVFGVLGMRSQIIKHRDFRPDSFAGFDLVVVGPGPGDPRDDHSEKIAIYRQAVDGLLATKQPFLAVCLGQQVLCSRLGIPLAYKDIVFQGTQAEVDLFGRIERVGFYNTFVGRGTDLPAGVTAATDPETGDIHQLNGPHFRGIQFHAESILSERGFDLLRDLVLDLVG